MDDEKPNPIAFRPFHSDSPQDGCQRRENADVCSSGNSHQAEPSANSKRSSCAQVDRNGRAPEDGVTTIRSRCSKSSSQSKVAGSRGRSAVPGCFKSRRSQREVRCHESCTGTKIGVVRNWLEWSLWWYQWCDKPGVNDSLVDVVKESC